EAFASIRANCSIMNEADCCSWSLNTSSFLSAVLARIWVLSSIFVLLAIHFVLIFKRRCFYGNESSTAFSRTPLYYCGRRCEHTRQMHAWLCHLENSHSVITRHPENLWYYLSLIDHV
uniref:Uncharacterized protein n=1 Tax=Parascaris univalens TaxID=6257 RepID=A0A915A4I0_PARUN